MPEQKFKTSFIPKKPAKPLKKGGVVVKSGASFMTIVATVIFIASIITLGGIFVYKLTLNNKIDSQNQVLKEASESFDSEFISEATRLSSRLSSVEGLIANHVAPSQVFRMLEDETLKTIRFENLKYSETEDGKLSLNVSGLANGFESIVLQSDRYGRTQKLRDVLFSGLQRNDSNLVTFDLEGLIEPELVLFSNQMNTNEETVDFDEDFEEDFGEDTEGDFGEDIEEDFGDEEITDGIDEGNNQEVGDEMSGEAPNNNEE